jgi:hypothetical protein
MPKCWILGLRFLGGFGFSFNFFWGGGFRSVLVFHSTFFGGVVFDRFWVFFDEPIFDFLGFFGRSKIELSTAE